MSFRAARLRCCASAPVVPVIPTIPPITPVVPSVPVVPPFVATPGLTSDVFTRTLRVGIRGADVTILQRQLIREGVYAGPVTGYFGALTQAAVRRYQLKQAIPVIGIVDFLTRSVLNETIALEGLPTGSTVIVTPVAPTPVKPVAPTKTPVPAPAKPQTIPPQPLAPAKPVTPPAVVAKPAIPPTSASIFEGVKSGASSIFKKMKEAKTRFDNLFIIEPVR